MQEKLPLGATFMLSQLGVHLSRRFWEKIEPLGVTPPHVGVLRLLAVEPIDNQRALADRLGVQPSRIVVLLDELNARGLVKRSRSSADRRNYELHLTDAGREMLATLAPIAAEHESELMAAYTPEERAVFLRLLEKAVQHSQLEPGIHPGYRNLKTR